jgi:Ca2+-binding EF-hand superfamily protein
MAKADEDNDKLLSRDEFVDQVTKDDPALPQQEAGIMFADMDEDYDKKVSIRELTLHMDEFEGNQAETEFYNTDSNGDSKVDEDEFVALYDASKSTLSREKMRARFRDVDGNQDGVIDMSEAKAKWEGFQPADGEKVKKQRKKKGINRGKVTERAKDQLQAVFRLESDKAELGKLLAAHELADIGDKLKGVGIENVAGGSCLPC